MIVSRWTTKPQNQHGFGDLDIATRFGHAPCHDVAAAERFGKVDPGEDFAAAVLRETQEEAGLDIEITDLVGASRFDMPRLHVVVLCMEARLTGGTLTLSEEHDAAEWVPLAELSHWDLTEHVRPLMLEYAEKKAAGSFRLR